jgi:hypothetical protein
MADLKSISPVPGSEKGVIINGKRYLKSFEVTINGYVLTVTPSNWASESFVGLLGDVQINGSTVTDPDAAIAALEFVVNFNEGGGNPSTPGDVPTLQQVTNKGNSTTKTISHSPAVNGSDSATLQQVNDNTIPITSGDIAEIFS